MPNFRVIIVGAGPVGLTTAHALSKAGIDFVVLERRQVVVQDVGASLVLAPQSLRVMSQLELLDQLTAISTELVHATSYTMDGKKFKEAWPFEVMKQNQTRQLMRSLTLKTSPEDTVNDEEPFTTEYRTMWCTFPKPEDSEIGLGSTSDGSNASVQYLTSKDRAWIFVYEHLEMPTKKRAWYSQEDVEAFAAEHAEMPINDHLKVKDVFAKKYHAGMANLEEGIIEHWSWGRIVLVGDAAHKFTPNHGQGLNNGIQDAVVLVNELHRCIESVGASNQPSKEELSIAFQRYQSTRTEYVKADYNLSATVTRMSAWPNFCEFCGVISRRRAQNRASQRAFRDRKEKYMRELEQRLRELEGRYNVLSRLYESLQLEVTSVKQELDRMGKDNSRVESSTRNCQVREWEESKIEILDPFLFHVSAFCFVEDHGQGWKE
ncbi:hypothetical protein SS1G_11540 [Sclerotinia sclerotiorum 1980 UF-70]|uniref:BZIP domain-containing protein n=1 Tax=Sclerotinia sclerotiorum (strain ATCC 18683 / 1980 / Ss-1) TaxID=665079 RepID=A7F1R9_SCLS1|nr:hypothetical protein SS1G_11540 [Sclerotinia sclerotiorum 1980 UF-70]EDN95661.1 hypothetical protein SS1G_11540 [Sclerotinia sclerotiorum 1980 UF-70]